jgi:hypothetical protein
MGGIAEWAELYAKKKYANPTARSNYKSLPQA